MAINGTPHTVPIIDLSAFTSDDKPESRLQTAKELATKCRVHGCVGISGHGVPAQLLKEAFDLNKRFFDLPHEDKMKAPHPDGAVPHRGYSATGREQAAAKTALLASEEKKKEMYAKSQDFKESYEVGSDENEVQYNIWLPPEIMPGFREFMTHFFWELNKLAVAMREALIMSLDLTGADAEKIRDLQTGHDNQLRLLHYPPVSVDDESFSRHGAHTDWSLFTFLFQDNIGGLEFGDCLTEDNFMAAVPMDGVVYMNIGDMFHRVSNGFYPSAMHRVVCRKKDGASMFADRYSIPYFVIPRSDMMIGPPQALVDRDGEQRFEPLTFDDYSNRMFKATNKH